MVKGSTRNITSTLHRISSIPFEESEEFEHMFSQLMNEVDEMNGSRLKQVDLSHSQENIKMEIWKK